MTTITNENVDEFCVTGEWVISASVKADQDSDEVKKVTLKFKMENTLVREIIASSLKDVRINWQAGARKRFNSIVDGSTVTVKYGGGRQPIDQKAQAMAYFASLTPEEREALLNQVS